MLVIPSNNIGAEVRLIPREDFRKAIVDAGGKGDWEFASQAGTPYAMARRFLRSPSGLPCNPPPWGVLNGVDVNTGDVKWTTPIGQFATAPPSFGTIALGGPIVTAGGLVFMAGTTDPAIHAYDVATGKQLWKGDLPTSARSTPMTFRGPNGKQYVVVSAGGHGIAGMSPLGDYLVAFALP
jgi:quinoprotein glucose dehydrogenase